jgi:glycosyltransferase involved in cell wall biosynthesis
LRLSDFSPPAVTAAPPPRRRLCVLFPHLILGGGETAMMALAEGLARHFDVAVCALDRRPMTLEMSARDELLRRFGAVSFIKTADELRAHFDHAAAALWFGMNPFTPETLEAMPARPASIRIVHTGKHEEGLEYHLRWRHCIDRAVCVSPQVARRIPGALFIPNTCSPDRLDGAETPLRLPSRPSPSGSGPDRSADLVRSVAPARAAASPSPVARPVLGFVGRLFPFKNVNWLVEHLAELGCDLVVQGLDTEELTCAGLLRLAAEHGVADRVRFLPPSPRVGAFLRSVDAVVVVSRQEGFPMAAIEAGLAGVPLIATRVGALPELLAEEALFVDSQDGAPSLDSMRRAIAGLGPAWGERLRARITRLCAQETVAAQYASLIHAVVAERAAERRREPGPRAAEPMREQGADGARQPARHAASRPAGTRAAGGEFSGTLTLTHSSRGLNLARCSPQFLASRFGDPERLRRRPPFDALRPAPRLYSGAVSVFRVAGTTGASGTTHAAGPTGSGKAGEARLAVELVGVLRCRDKLQHVAPLGERYLLAGFEHRVERWRLPAPLAALRSLDGMTVEARFEHPHLAGLHTVEALFPDRAVLSCAAADAVLLLDPETGSVERTLRLPEALYGAGYPLAPGSDLRRHYIGDELQAAHPNAAFADASRRWVAVSTLIQGAVGIFDLRGGDYQEVTRGFVGCHGARFGSSDEIYFADSTTGTLVVLDDDGRAAFRFATGSRWLHDVQQLQGSLYAFALADRNELRIYDTASGALLYRRRFPRVPFTPPPALGHRLPGWLGNSVQALAFRPDR